MNGVLLVDKPAGPTSHDVVYAIRRLVGAAKVGHAGSLDPFATGLLVMLVGAATKISDYLLGQDKVYEAVLQWGAATDTLDRDGQIVEATEAPLPDRETTAAALAAFVGEFLQEPPMYSAKKIDGQPLHRLARQGKVVERATTPIAIRAIELLGHDPAAKTVAFRVRAAKGLYVRSLGDALARRLGGVGHLQALRRIASGNFSVDSAVTVEMLKELAADQVERRLLPIDRVLAGLGSATLSPGASLAMRHGTRPPAAEVALAAGFAGGDVVRLLGDDGGLLALARARTDAARVPEWAEAGSPFELLRVFVGGNAE